MNEFWNHEINVGYYDKIVKIGINKKRGARAYWHITTLKTIKTYLLKFNSSRLCLWTGNFNRKILKLNIYWS